MKWLMARFNADARRWHRLWSMRVALFWAGLNGAVLMIPAFSDFANPWLLTVLNMAGFMLIAGARITKQPGLE